MINSDSAKSSIKHVLDHIVLTVATPGNSINERCSLCSHRRWESLVLHVRAVLADADVTGGDQEEAANTKTGMRNGTNE